MTLLTIRHGCLSEEALFGLSEGAGTESHQEHLASCEYCTQRYQRLIQDLELLGHVLQQPPPLHTIIRPRQAPFFQPIWRWSVRVTAVAALCALVWTGWWLRGPLQLMLSPGALNTEVLSFVKADAVPALFSTSQIGVGRIPTEATDGDYLVAAVDGGWPCEYAGDVRCGADPVSVLISVSLESTR